MQRLYIIEYETRLSSYLKVFEILFFVFHKMYHGFSQ